VFDSFLYFFSPSLILPLKEGEEKKKESSFFREGKEGNLYPFLGGKIKTLPIFFPF